MSDKEYRCKCGCNKMIVINKTSCSDCKHNGIYVSPDDVGRLIETHPHIESDSYIYLETVPEGFTRSEAEYDYQCELGDTNGEGCWIFTCSECNKIVEMIPCAD